MYSQIKLKILTHLKHMQHSNKFSTTASNDNEVKHAWLFASTIINQIKTVIAVICDSLMIIIKKNSTITNNASLLLQLNSNQSNFKIW